MATLRGYRRILTVHVPKSKKNDGLRLSPEMAGLLTILAEQFGEVQMARRSNGVAFYVPRWSRIL